MHEGMGTFDEAAQLRRRLTDLEGELGHLRADQPDGAIAKTVITVSEGGYPATASAVYAVREVIVSLSSEAEGAMPSMTPIGDNFHAGNLGSAVPPVGTTRLAELQDGVWIFTFNG